MKQKYIAVLIACASSVAFAQTPPTPPTPPNPPAPPQDRQDKAPKVPVTWLGVDTSPIPSVLCEQMNLQKGFGLVVDYVVPNGPAATAGIQQNDILKMLNDQILMEPGQLSKLIRSYPEGTTVTLTVLRKGKEEKVSVKLGKKEVPQRHGMMDFHFGDRDFGDLGDTMRELREQIGEGTDGMIHDAVMTAQAEAQRVREQAQVRREESQRVREEAQRVREQAQRAREQAHRISEQVREEARRAAGQITVNQTTPNGLQTTKIDIGKAQIVFSDNKGELRLENADGKKMLTAKDPQGRLLFSGPVETAEDLNKMPADVRKRYDDLKERDLPSVNASDDEDDQDADDGDDDEDDSSGDEESVEQASFCSPAIPQALPHSIWAYRTILI
jgi:serine protease Do